MFTFNVETCSAFTSSSEENLNLVDHEDSDAMDEMRSRLELSEPISRALNCGRKWLFSITDQGRRQPLYNVEAQWEAPRRGRVWEGPPSRWWGSGGLYPKQFVMLHWK